MNEQNSMRKLAGQMRANGERLAATLLIQIDDVIATLMLRPVQRPIRIQVTIARPMRKR